MSEGERPLIRDCHDCRYTFAANAMVGMGSPPRWLCLKCFEKRLKESRKVLEAAKELFDE